jgi:hypothetical protein
VRRLFSTQLLRRSQRAQIKHVTLHHALIGAAAILHQAPILVNLSIFAPLMRSQEQGHKRRCYKRFPGAEGPWSALHGKIRFQPFDFWAFRRIYRRKFLKTGSSCESRVKRTAAFTPVHRPKRLVAFSSASGCAPLTFAQCGLPPRRLSAQQLFSGPSFLLGKSDKVEKFPGKSGRLLLLLSNRSDI